MGIVAMIVGGILGAMTGDEFGFLVGVVLGWLVHRSLHQGRQIAALRDVVARLQAAPHDSVVDSHLAARREDANAARAPSMPQARAAPAPGGVPGGDAAGGEPTTALPAAAPSEGTAGATARRPRDNMASHAPSVAMTRTAAAEVASSTEAGLHANPPAAAMADGHGTAGQPADGAPAASPEPPARDAGDLFAPVRRWFFGGNTIVKTGVAILFIGLAFLAKYASEHVQVPVELRLAGIGAVAIALLIVGWRLRLRRPGYSQVLQGGAVAVLYLTLFVAFRFYGLLATGPVFALMVCVAALSAALAVLQDARSLALVGAVGGFATPLLVSTGAGNHVALFSYYLVLDLGIAAVAWYRTWRSLNLVGFTATYLVGTAWSVLQYRPEHYASGQAFVFAYFAVFMAILLMPARRLRDGDSMENGLAQRADRWVNGSLLFGLPTITFALQYALVRDTPYGAAVSALALAAVYVGLAMWLRSRAGLRLLFEASIAIATVFLTLVIPFALDARSTAGAWALEGAGLVWLGLRQARPIARIAGYALLLLSGFSMLLAHERHGAPDSIFNAYLFNAAMAAAASIAAAYFVHRRRDMTAARVGEPAAEPVLVGWATLWLVSTAIHHIGLFVPAGNEASAWLAFVSVLALAYVGLSVRLGWRTVALPVALHAPLIALQALMSLAMVVDPLRHGGWWAWPLALATHAAALRYAAPQWPAFAQTTVHTLGVLVVAALGALEGRAITAGWGDASSAWPWLGWLAAPAALLLWLPRTSTAGRWPVRASPRSYLSTAAAILAAGLLLWTILANFGSDGSARPLPHVPLVNPLDVGIGIALLACLHWMRSDGARHLPVASPNVQMALLAACAFVWINAVLVRAFHHYGGVPYRIAAWADSLAVHTGVTLLWSMSALVLMWWSARRAVRLPWIAGAALLGAVVVKLLLVDLSGSGTVTRIVSFISVGVLMLVIGYVAPLPTKEPRHVAG
jgi:uncharacterized membrane protein